MFFKNKYWVLSSKLCTCLCLCVVMFFFSCNTKSKKPVVAKENKVSAFAISIQQEIKNAINNHESLYVKDAVARFYEANNHFPIWSDTAVFFNQVKSLRGFLDTATYCGIAPAEYHADSIRSYIALADVDSLHKLNTSFWANADVVLTDAYFRMMLHLHEGRLIEDSNSVIQFPAKADSFFLQGINSFLSGENINVVFANLQPHFPAYHQLRNGLASFIENMDTTSFTEILYPYDTTKLEDSLIFITSLCKRLAESNHFEFDSSNDLPDSATLSESISSYQKASNIKVDGKISVKLIQQLNKSDRYRLKQILISMDRYKTWGDSLPESFIFVNLPQYELQAWHADSIALRSKIICGKPKTPTPILQSKIKEIITYPTWTIPPSIIKSEVLPAMKRNPAYLSRKGYGLFDKDGKKIDPSAVNWSKYSKGIPYFVRQGSGANNALGVIKFNFPNPHHVYLHDTNQRYLFGNSSRAMSHGCVRVEQWEKLAGWIAFHDSVKAMPKDTLTLSGDSILRWVSIKKRKAIGIKNPIQLYIVYITCEGRDGKIIIHDDIYQLDKKLMESKAKSSVFNLIRA
jgi:murein L,D-transpeptidase YcbB/YkuD